MPDLNELKTSIINDRKVDATEVDQLRSAIRVGSVNREQANILFEINNAVSGNDNDPGWPVYFSEAIASHVLDDETTPGVISDEEATYLKSSIDTDGTVDASERALLQLLKTKAQQPVPAVLTSMYDKYLS